MNIYRPFLFVVIGLSCLLVLHACSGRSNSTVQAPAAQTTYPVTVQVHVLDAQTQLPIQLSSPDTVSLWVYGEGAKRLVDSSGNSTYDTSQQLAGPFTASSGVFALYMKPDATPATAATLRIVASAPNYIMSSQQITAESADFTSATGETTVLTARVPLINQTTPPDSVTVKTQTVTVSGGITGGAPITVTTDAATGSVQGSNLTLGSAQVVVPASTTVFTDASGTTRLPTGTARLTVAYNNNQTASSLSVFPGGFLTMEDPNGQALTSPGTFISGGFASVELTSTAADGTVTKAKTFSQPITLTITIPKRTTNPLTGAAVKAGDVIPIWSYDTATGVWSAMKLRNGTIITGTLGALDSTSNTYPVTFQTDHLSYFNLDWFAWKYSAGKSWVPQCDRTPISIKGAKGNKIYLEVSLPGGGWMHPMQLYADASAPAVAYDYINNAPQGLPVLIDAYLNTDTAVPSKKVGAFAFDDLCAGVSLDITTGVNAALTSNPVQHADFKIRTRKVCSQDASVTTPLSGVSILVAAQGSPTVSTVSDSGGLATLKSLEVGQTYRLYVNDSAGTFTASWLQALASTTASISRTFNVASSNADKYIDFPVTCSQLSPTGTSTGTSTGTGTTTGTGTSTGTTSGLSNTGR